MKEFARILKPKRKIALVWNDRDVNGNDIFTRQHDRIITQASNNSPIHYRLYGQSKLQFLFPNLKHHSFPHQQALDRDGLIALAMSASYMPKTGTAHQKLVTELINLQQQYCDKRGLVYLQYKTSLYLTESV